MPNFRPVYRIALVVVALMSGALSIAREVLQIIDPEKYHEKPLFIACLTVACILAFALLWWEERQGRIQAEKVVKDDMPKLGVNIEGIDGRRAWMEHAFPVVFTIKHLAGRLPTSIRFEPIPSKQGKFSLCFAALPHVEQPPQRTTIRFEVLEVGVPPLNARDRETIKTTEKDMLMLFLDDSPNDWIELDYPVVTHFKDGEDSLDYTFHLRFNMVRYGFAEDTTP